jgi:hypothetical protein
MWKNALPIRVMIGGSMTFSFVVELVRKWNFVRVQLKTVYELNTTAVSPVIQQ